MPLGDRMPIWLIWARAVNYGRGEMIVTSNRAWQTEIGNIATMLHGQVEEGTTPLQRRLNHFGTYPGDSRA